MWFREHRPDIYEKAWKFTGWQEIFHVRLGLNAVMDYSLASHTMLMNIHTKKYIYDLLHTCKIDVEKFFPLSNSSSIAGRIDDPYSSQLGVNDGSAVVAGDLTSVARHSAQECLNPTQQRSPSEHWRRSQPYRMSAVWNRRFWKATTGFHST